MAVDIFRHVAMFAELEDSDLVMLASVSRAEKYRRDQVILNTDNPKQEIVLVVQGEARVLTFMSDGRPVTVGHVDPGEMMGMVVLAEGVQWKGMVVADVDGTVAYHIPAALVRRLMIRYRSVSRGIVDHLGNVLAETRELLGEIVDDNVAPRTAAAGTRGRQRTRAAVGKLRPPGTNQKEAEDFFFAGSSKDTPARERWTPERVKRLRRLLGFTVQDLAVELELSLSTVARWEMGVTQPGNRSSQKLARLEARVAREQ